MSDGQFSRLESLIGQAALQRLAQSQVTVAGLGAVGSFAVEALARSGVGRLHLIDFDLVEPSNINRQLYALHTTLGEPKVQIAARRIREINPACQIDISPIRLNNENCRVIFEKKPDLILDAIDSVDDKVALICDCLSHRIPVISSMGAARRHDPARVRVGGLGAVQGCPLAKKVRAGLAKGGFGENSTEGLLQCVYSTEPAAALPPLGIAGGGVSRLGSSICVTGSFGLAMAAAAIGRLTTPAQIRRV